MGPDGRTSDRRLAWLLAVTLAAAAYALLVAATGGFDARVAGIRVRSRDWARPAMVAAAGAAWIVYRARRPLGVRSAEAWRHADTITTSRVLVGAAAAWTLVAALAFGTFAIGGADSYGYAGQARLLRHGSLTDTIPLKPAFRWPDARATLIPLGFTGGREPGVMAPQYPPGLPLLMAAFGAVSEPAIFLVVPLFGVLAVWCTYRLGASLGQPLAGGLAAVFLSVSPTFLYQLVQPMGDIPAAACWLAALIAASRQTQLSAGGAGVLTALAIAIRPNLAPLAGLIVLPLLTAAGGVRWRRVAAFAAALAPGVIALGWIQHVRYGSPRWFRIRPDRRRVCVREHPAQCRALSQVAHRDPHALHLVVGACAGVGDHCRPQRAARVDGDRAARLPSGERPSPLRVLPAARVVLHALPAAGDRDHAAFRLDREPLCAASSRPAALRLPVAMLLVGTLVAAFAMTARSRQVFELREHERKYPDAGAFAREHLPADAFILAAQHSGSLRYYANRPTLRWDVLGPGHLDEALAELRADGYEPFAVLDADEDAEFRSRFGGAGQRAVAGSQAVSRARRCARISLRSLTRLSAPARRLA